MDNLCYLCLVFAMLSCLFNVALWSPAGRGLTSWLLFVMFNCVFVTFPFGILGQMWYLIVSIPDLCRLSYFKMLIKSNKGPDSVPDDFSSNTTKQMSVYHLLFMQT